MYSLGQCLNALIVGKYPYFMLKQHFLKILYFVHIASSSVTGHQ